MPGKRLHVLLIALALAGCKRKAPAPPPATAPTSTPATTPASTSEPATAPATAPTVIRELKDIYALRDPKIAAQKRLLETLPLWESLHLEFSEPVHLDTRGDLWITSDRAEPIGPTLAEAPKLQSHVVAVKVLLAHWFNDAAGQTKVRLITPGASADSFELIDAQQSISLTIPGAQFARARMWNDLIIVPDAGGYSIIRGDGTVAAMPMNAGADAEVAFVFDNKGILAWSTPRTSIGPTTVMRYADNAVEDFTQKYAWPAGLAQLVPLLDGNMLTISRTASGLNVSQVLMAQSDVDVPAIEALVKQLSDRDPAKRQAATASLGAYGSGAWPVLERLLTKQPPEARMRIQTLLGDRTSPALADMRPVPGGAVVASRLQSGVVLFFENGVEHFNLAGVKSSVAPAWLAVEPGLGITLLSPGLVGDLLANKTILAHIGEDWIVQATPDGPMRWMANHFEPIAGKSESSFKVLEGIDSRGRWVLRGDDGRTLLIDTHLADDKPRLPTWQLELEPGTITGWDAKNQTAIKRGSTWSLGKSGWETCKEPPTTTVSDDRGQPTIGTAGDTSYTGGLDSLTIVSATSSQTLPLPAEAVGRGVEGKAFIVKSGEHFFLFNDPARIVRLKLDNGVLVVDGTFTRGLPVGEIRRMWLDPHDRLIIASGKDTLTICFPSGRMSDDMMNMVPAEQLKAMRE